MVKLCETNEEFEAIIAREVVHIEKRHLLREYLKYQQGALIAAIVATVVGTTNNQRQELLKALSEFAQITLSAGFSRRLEEEADAIAMVYCMSRGLDKTPLLSILDKLKTRATTRLGYVPTVSSFSNLPDLKARINQIKTSQLISLDEPIIMLANQLKKDNAIEKYETGFISLSFNYLYIAKSSTNINKSIVNIIGSVMNSHENISFKVDPLEFRTSKTGGIVTAKMEPIIIEYQSITDFSAKLHLNDEDVESVTIRIKSKFPLITGFRISKVVTAPGKKERTISFEKINTSYVFE